MPARKVGLPTDVPDDLARGLAAIRERLSIPTEFPADVLAAAEGAAARPRLVDHDRTDLELITIDPPDARDLDQALHMGGPPTATSFPTPSPMWPPSSQAGICLITKRTGGG